MYGARQSRKHLYHNRLKSEVVKLDEIPSSKTTSYKPMKDTSYKLEESKKFTVAPAYNKGAYQVIPRGDVEWIGK